MGVLKLSDHISLYGSSLSSDDIKHKQETFLTTEDIRADRDRNITHNHPHLLSRSFFKLCNALSDTYYDTKFAPGDSSSDKLRKVGERILLGVGIASAGYTIGEAGLAGATALKAIEIAGSALMSGTSLTSSMTALAPLESEITKLTASAVFSLTTTMGSEACRDPEGVAESLPNPVIV